jgi:hypothetical protein
VLSGNNTEWWYLVSVLFVVPRSERSLLWPAGLLVRILQEQADCDLRHSARTGKRSKLLSHSETAVPLVGAG